MKVISRRGRWILPMVLPGITRRDLVCSTIAEDCNSLLRLNNPDHGVPLAGDTLGDETGLIKRVGL